MALTCIHEHIYNTYSTKTYPTTQGTLSNTVSQPIKEKIPKKIDICIGTTKSQRFTPARDTTWPIKLLENERKMQFKKKKGRK